MNRFSKALLRLAGTSKDDIKLLELKRMAGEPLPHVSPAGNNRPAIAFNSWNSHNAIKDGFKGSAWVYTALDRIMEASSSVPLKVELLTGSEWKADDKHPLAQLIKRPNPYESMDFLTQMATAHLNLSGNAAWHVVTAGAVDKKPWQLWVIKPSEIKPLASAENFLGGYEVQRSGMSKQKLEAHEIVHWMFPDPDNLFWGMAPLEAASRAVDTDIAAVRWNKNIIDNRGVTDTAFMLEGMQTKEQYELAEAQILQQLNVRNSSKARIPWVVGGGKIQSFGHSPVDLDYTNGRKMTREEIAAVFGVPLILMGVLEGATYANLEAAKRLFWEDVIAPTMEAFCDTLTRALAVYWEPGFNPLNPLSQPIDRTIRVVPDFSNVQAMQETFNTKVKNAAILRNMGYSLNDINRRLELGMSDVQERVNDGTQDTTAGS